MGLAIVLNKKTASPNGKLTFGLKRKIPSDIIYGRKKKRIQKQTMNEVHKHFIKEKQRIVENLNQRSHTEV